MSALQLAPDGYIADCYAIRVEVDLCSEHTLWVAHVGACVLACDPRLEEVSWRLEELSPQQVARAVAAAVTPRPRPEG